MGGDIGKLLKLRVGALQFNRDAGESFFRAAPLNDFMLQFGHVFLQLGLGSLEFAIAPLDLPQHLIKPVNEVADFIAIFGLSANPVILLL